MKNIIKKQDMERDGIITNLDSVLCHVHYGGRKEEGFEKEFNEHMVKMGSIRYKVFSQKGCKCITCGIEGKYFAIERHKNTKQTGQERFHLNLFAIDEDGDEVLMTVDHTIPASCGGERIVKNLEPMCTVCNAEKGCKII